MVQFTHKRLARHEGIWRVDGIGPIEARGRLGARAIVHFSGLTEAGLSDPYKKLSLNGETLKLRVHAASIRNFRAGTIWRDGKRVAGAPPIRTPFRIDAGQVRLVALGASVNLNGDWASTVLPDRYLSFGGDNRQALLSTLYAIVPILEDRMTQWLVVPAVELLRFYIGVSSRLLSGAMQGLLGNYVEWEKSRMEGARPVLHVKQRLSRKEAAVLSRAVASISAKTILHGVHQHLSAIHSNNAPLDQGNKRPLIIKANFPFTDTTQLYVSGKRMPLISKEGKEQWAIYAMEILVCSHPPGFPGFILESDDSFENRTALTREGRAALPPHHQPLLENDEDEYELDDLPADKRLARLVTLSYTNQFSGFGELKVEHRHPPCDRLTFQPGAVIDVPIDAYTEENGSYSDEAQGNLGISEFQSRIDHIDREITLFLKMLQHLRSIVTPRNWKISTRMSKDGLSQNGELIAFFPRQIGKRRTWHLVVDLEDKTRPRQVVWVEVITGSEGRIFYLLEMELKPSESGQCTILLHTNDFSSLDERTFHELLKLTAIQNRWPDRHNKWREKDHYKRAQALFSKVKMHRINHPHPPRAQEAGKASSHQKPELSPKSWSKVLLEKIDELLPIL
jgi:hypothetical protein